MAYKFYGADTPGVTPITDLYKGVKNQRHLYDLLSSIWCKATCAPRMQNEWSKDNKTLGQCSITAFLAQDIFGGEVFGVPLKDGNYHCFNKIGNIVFDLTSEQFKGIKLDYDNVIIQNRDSHFAKEEKYKRYLYLKEELLKVLK